MTSHPNPGRVLFFGRQNCEGTAKVRSLLAAAGFTVDYIESTGFGQQMPAAVNDWVGEYIFCYRSYFILRKPLLERAAIAAINFHPGPPEYPGSGCINFALYEGAGQYGVTAHLINEKVDNGTILKAVRFPILTGDGVPSLLERTHANLQALALDVISGIAATGPAHVETCIAASNGEEWTGTARKMRELSALQAIEANIGADELARRMRAAHTREYPLHLTLHGKKFVLDHD